MRKLLRILLKYLPPALKHTLIRRSLRIKDELASDITFKIAQDRDELEQAFRLLHDCYVAEGLMDPHPSGMRITPYHALPTTTTLIATKGKRVVGTVSIIADGGFGFPLEALFDADSFRERGLRIAEISSLAIARDMRISGSVLFPFQKFMFAYVTRYMGIDEVLIAVHPNKVDYFDALLGFKKLGDCEVKSYSFVKGAPAVGLSANMREMFDAGLKSDLPVNADLRRYVAISDLDDRYQFPERRFKQIFDGVMTPDLLKYFFKDRVDVMGSLSADQIATLHYLYNDIRYRNVLPPVPSGHLKDRRETPRFYVACQGLLDIEGKRTVNLRIIDVSQHGFRALLASPIRFGTAVTIKVALGDFDVGLIKAKPIWSNNSNVFGFRIAEPNALWEDFLATLEAQSQGSFKKAS